MHTGFWRRNIKELDYLDYLDLRWENNIDTDVKETHWKAMDWFGEDQDSHKW